MKFTLILALALLIGGAMAAETKLPLVKINWEQSLPSDSNVTLTDGFVAGTGGIVFNGTAPTATDGVLYSDSGILKWDGAAIGSNYLVTVGDGDQFDIDIGDYTAGDQGEAITDAVDLLMSRYDNRGGTVAIAPCLINDSSATSAIYLNHTSANGASLKIIGSGVGWSGGTIIESPYGILIGAFCDSSDGVYLEDFYLIGNSATPANVGISSNRSVQRVHISDIRVGGFDYGINLTSYYDNSMRNVEVSNCDEGCVYIQGNHNVLDNVVTSQDPYCPDSYGIYVVGDANVITADIGIAGEDSGSKGLWIAGDQNNVLSCWVEPIDTEGNRAYIQDGDRNQVVMAGSDNTAPYGNIHLTGGYENFIDPGYAPYTATTGLFLNVTFSTSFYNRIKMSQHVQTASRGVIGLVTAESLDYGFPRMTAAPNSDYWYVGTIVWNSAPASGQPEGWICTATGSPGTWRALANAA